MRVYASDGAALQRTKGTGGGAATHNRRSLSQAVAAGALRRVLPQTQEQQYLLGGTSFSPFPLMCPSISWQLLSQTKIGLPLHKQLHFERLEGTQ